MPTQHGTIVLAILGAGSVRCMPAVIGSLGTYFGERPLELRFWETDDERLDLFDRFARLCFAVNKCTHSLISTDDPQEALEGATRVIACLDENCARKYKPAPSLTPVKLAKTLIDREIADALPLNLLNKPLSLKSGRVPPLGWPQEPSEAALVATPHQILRYLHEDEYLHDFFRTYSQSPIKDWLNTG